jgi:hypothetical protein
MRRTLPAAAGIALVLVSLLVSIDASASSPGSARVIPTQFIAKQYTEGLGRAPSPREWTAWIGYYRRSGGRCHASGLSALVRHVYFSREFLKLGYDRSARLAGLYRGVLNRDLDRASHRRYARVQAWRAVVGRVLDSGEFRRLVGAACSRVSSNYGFNTGTPPFRLGVGVRGFHGSGEALRQLIEKKAATGGGTVWLAQGAVIPIGQSGNRTPRLDLPAGVRLATIGLPDNRRYLKMARLIRAGDTCFFDACGQPVVTLHGGASASSPGARLSSVWIDGGGGDPRRPRFPSSSVVQIEANANASVIESRLTSPIGSGRNVLGIQGLGGPFRIPCARAQASRNLLTAYTSAHTIHRRWSDGITIGCENAVVHGNTVVDASDVGIVVFGVPGASQRSVVRDNYILSAGNGAFAALAADPHGVCAETCSDDATRSFAGTRIERNTFVTGPRTSFGFGVVLGTRALFGKPPDGQGATAVDNTTGTARARVSLGLAVSGMFGATIRGNGGNLDLVRANRCPMSRAGASVSSGLASVIRPAQLYRDVLINACWT